nr:Chain E, Velcro peptide [synthetic construct]
YVVVPDGTGGGSGSG